MYNHKTMLIGFNMCEEFIECLGMLFIGMSENNPMLVQVDTCSFSFFYIKSHDARKALWLIFVV